MKIFLLILIQFFFFKLYGQVPARERPGYVWIVAHTETQNGNLVKISGHWEGKRSASSKVTWVADPACAFCGYYKKNVSTDAGSTGSTSASKEVAINENNTTGTSTNKIIRAGGSMQKTGELKTKNERFCFNQQMVSRKIADKFGLMNTRSEIYPGNIIQGKNFLSGAYTQVTKPMNPIKLYIGNIMFTDENKAIKTILEPTRATLSTAVLPMVNNTFEGKLQADLEFESSEVLSRSDMLLNCNIHADGFFLTLDNKFSISKSTYSTTIMLSFIQKYFTVNADMPQSDSIFKDHTIPDDDMLYIRSVTYGRRGILFITVDSTATTIIDSLKANYDAIIKHVSLSANLLKSSKLQNATITGYVFGGSAGNAAKIFNPDPKKTISEFYNVLQSGAEFSKENFGRPIEYEVAYLKTGELASIEYNVNETRKICDEGQQQLKITLNYIKAIYVGADGGAGGDRTADIFGIVAAHLSTPDFKVNKPDTRFGNQAPYFDNKNKNKEYASIRLAAGGKTPVTGDYRLWTATRQENKQIRAGQEMPINKSVSFLYTPGNPLTEIILFANFDEADDDDDDLMDDGNEEFLFLKPPKPISRGGRITNKYESKTVVQNIGRKNSGHDHFEISYTIEVVPIH